MVKPSTPARSSQRQKLLIIARSPSGCSGRLHRQGTARVAAGHQPPEPHGPSRCQQGVP